MDQKVVNKRNTNYAFKLVGYLGHDNKLFDRVCSGGCKGLFSSREYSACPKCGRGLSYILSADNKPMAISEGTVYPAFGPKQEKRDASEVAKRKNGMRPIYRFKMFSFMDEQGILTAPIEHDKCLRGAKVEILSMNHQLVPSWFEVKAKESGQRSEIRVELLVMIYTNYGDKVTVLTEREYAGRIGSYPVNAADGTPAPITLPAQNDDERLDMLQRQIDEIRAAKTAQAAAVPAPQGAMVAQDTVEVPWEGEDELVDLREATDPFAAAI
jgi:hypothetical protein